MLKSRSKLIPSDSFFFVFLERFEKRLSENVSGSIFGIKIKTKFMVSILLLRTFSSTRLFQLVIRLERSSAGWHKIPRRHVTK